MANSDKPAANSFVRRARKVYNPIGFRRAYNFILFFIFGGAMLGFVLARLEYLNFNGIFCNPNEPGGVGAAPGECYWYKGFRQEKIGIILHLATILPASFLAVFQFIPAIRYRAILYHRIAGYVIILLALCGSAGALMLAPHAFGGDNATRLFIGLTVIMTTVGLFLAYVNVKRLQLDQHRAWMIRTWFYFGSIITLRIILVSAVSITNLMPSAQMFVGIYCEKIKYMYGGSTHALYGLYPACNPANPAYNGYTAVQASLTGGGPAEAAAALDSYFGMAGLLALAIHAIGVEVYLNLTPRETERLRNVSYEKQMERGFSRPGSAGIVAQRFGDAEEWLPKEKKQLQKTNTTTPTTGFSPSRSDSESDRTIHGGITSAVPEKE